MQIGPYEVTGELGRGGMGVVFAVRHPEDPRPLALKVVLAHAASPTALARLEREALAMAKVSHPHVVRIVSVGRLPQGPYLVLERIEGEALEERLLREPLAPAEAARIGAELAAALGALHRAGIVHRDVKPANVMLRQDGSAVLLDLGLAHDESAETLTKSGQLLGTPAFMSPEQAAGRHGEVDERADVYSLGATLFAAVVGRPPFEEDSVVALARAILHDEPRWPREVPADLVAILACALAKRPEARYPSAAALEADLRAFAAGERPAAAARRRRRALLAALGALALGLLGAALWSRGGRAPEASAGAAAGEPASAPASAQGPATAVGVGGAEPEPVKAREEPLDLPALARLAPEARVAAAAGWLRRHPAHAQREEVQRVYVAAKLERGPRQLAETGARAALAWRGPARLLVAHTLLDAVRGPELLLYAWEDVTYPSRPFLLDTVAQAFAHARPVVHSGAAGPTTLFFVNGAQRAALVPSRGRTRWLGFEGVERGTIVRAVGSPDGRWVAVGYDHDESELAGSIELYAWEALAGAARVAPAPVARGRFGTRVVELAFLDERTLIAHGYPLDRELQVWEVGPEGTLEPRAAHVLPGVAATFTLHPNRRWLALGTTATWSLVLLDLATGELVSALRDPRQFQGDARADAFMRANVPPAHLSRPRALAFSPDGSLLYSVGGYADAPSELKVWTTGPDPTTHGEWIAPLIRPSSAPSFQDAALSPDGRWLVTLGVRGSQAAALELWDVAPEPPPE